MPSLHDTRLLNNLLKTEKDALQAFKHYTLTASSASAALSAWSVADSADTGDIMDAALRISTLLSTLTDSQRTYLHALTSYRASLKDVLARETALRTVVRDREILVNRLIKIGNKRPKGESERQVEEHVRKVEEAQRELRACETYLQEEELALAHAKRASFRIGLAQRMRAMAELARTMEHSANEAVSVLEGLGGSEEFDEADYKHHHVAYDLASDAGDSIAPSQSASQAMSRASSSSSLSDLARPPPIPENLPIASSPRQRTRSLSPAPRAGTPALATKSQPSQPIMPAVPSAPPPISHQVYTERVPGLPTFEIPKAPDLSRRPDWSDESDYSDDENATHVRRANGLQGAQRSSHYPLDSPPHESRPAFAPQTARLRRKAASETSSLRGEGRKRRGSFLGGLVGLFKRGGKEKEGRAERQYASDPYGGGAGGGYGGQGSADYAGARSRLTSSTSAAEGQGGVHDAVRLSVMNAGKRPAVAASSRRGGGGGESSDDELDPRNVVRHVNDPKARLKALSDVGRPSSPARPVKEKRPALVRKGTSQSRASTVRPLSTVDILGGGGGEKKVKRKVKKAASDIGVTTSGWSSTVPPPPPQPGSRIEVPKAPATNQLAPLSGPPPLPTASSSAATNGTGSATPRGVAYATPQGTGTPTETGSLKKKKKVKSGGVREPSETVILSAEALGIPTSASTSSKPVEGGLARSGTVKSTATAATTGTVKKKKRATSFSAGAPPAIAPPVTNGTAPSVPLPTADELASTLPSARSSFSPFTTQLPRPDDDPYGSKSTKALSTAQPVQDLSASTGSVSGGGGPKLAKFADKKSKRLSALHGVGEGNWVSNPSSSSAVGAPPPAAAAPAPAKQPRRADVVHEGDESLHSVVDRAEGAETVQPSRVYGSSSKPQLSSLVVPPTPTLPSLPSPSGALNGALPAAPPASNQTSSADAVLPRPPAPATNGFLAPSSAAAAPSTPQLAKRKSVRLGDITDAGLSPSNSIRSVSSSGQAGAGVAKRGILVQRDPSPSPAAGSHAAALPQPESGAWPTRSSIRQQMDADTSSDEEGGGGSAYRAARKMLGRGTREWENALSGKEKGKGKGKGRAD
ncbi:hypothetical protein JCM8097_004347 [Rhodosporidiobolus ruineniae]